MNKKDLKKIISEGIDDLNKYRAKRKSNVQDRLQKLRERPASDAPSAEPVINWKTPEKWNHIAWLLATIKMALETPLWCDSDNEYAFQRSDIFEKTPKAASKRRAAALKIRELAERIGRTLEPSKPLSGQLEAAVGFMRDDLFPKWDKFCTKYLKKPGSFAFSPAYLLAAKEPLELFIKKERSAKRTDGWDYDEPSPKKSISEWEL